MSIYLTEPAWAKINRFLHVTGIRPDGYHTLRTVMQTVSLCDRISFRQSERDEKLVFICSDPALENESNLCVKAVRVFEESAGFAVSGRLKLDKRIPWGAGLGGGSADAAAVLRLLQRRFGRPLTDEQLMTAARRLGADVPFCVRGGRALCEGIGDVITPLPDERTEHMLIVKGKSGLSTPDMYRALDGRENVLSEKRASDNEEGNDFEQAAFLFLPEIRSFMEALKTLGAFEVRMSGSGSAVFGVFASAAAAKKAEQAFSGWPHNPPDGGGIPVFTAVCRTIPRLTEVK